MKMSSLADIVATTAQYFGGRIDEKTAHDIAREARLVFPNNTDAILNYVEIRLNQFGINRKFRESI